MKKMKKIKILAATMVVALSVLVSSVSASAATTIDLSGDDPSATETGSVERGHENEYEFDVETSGTYIIKTVGSYTDFDTEATLTDTETGESWTDDDGGDDLNFRFRKHLEAGHRYELAVYGHGNSHGQYKLKIYKL